MSKGTLLVTRDGPVATVLLSNPGRRNTLTARMWREFAVVLAPLAEDPDVLVVIIRGDGEDFSAGADISDLKAILHNPDNGLHDGGDVTAGEEAIAAFPKPVIAAVDGYCLGGAWQVAGACDFRLASDRAVFGITPAKIGIVYPLSGIERLVRLAGPGAAKYLLFSGDFVPAEQALRLGLVERVIPQADFWTDVASFAHRLAGRSQLSLQAMKELVDIIAFVGTEGAGHSGRNALEQASNRWQEEMAAAADPGIGVRAFLAKEDPVFTWTGPGRTQANITDDSLQHEEEAR
ncbi:enoyl-CoA hydratase/isomerase family protein [Arthrobacter gengyunqii]|uniref:Enoyl-CoA hydratase/isomerase family protein n=1 Tax=Arthrobacter gengyunqii TaxID=2886940 RepID=A0ABS8GEP1_9MICC|nr:enoyl-CoA hydratase/isomerase family protein [Arthrobacter gengyunqii]MCC3265075.1 enoyl-CoA hydratase/isomerase family protein [Arthrobacter gengyunqii]